MSSILTIIPERPERIIGNEIRISYDATHSKKEDTVQWQATADRVSLDIIWLIEARLPNFQSSDIPCAVKDSHVHTFYGDYRFLLLLWDSWRRSLCGQAYGYAARLTYLVIKWRKLQLCCFRRICLTLKYFTINEHLSTEST